MTVHKNKIACIAFTGGLMLLTACSKSFLNRAPYNALPFQTSIQSEADLGVATIGMYSGLRNTDLFGRTLPLKGDLMADNAFVTSNNSNRYITLNNYAFSSADQYAGAIWANAYATIKFANTVINAILDTTDANISQYRGEAYAVRALMHFELVRNYAHPFTVAPDSLGVAIDTSFSLTAFNPFVKPARSTVRQVYAAVISDLEKAYSLMTEFRGTAYFSKYAARALEARVYQNMGDWPDALTTAVDVINNSGWVMLSAPNYVAPVGTLSTKPSLSTYSPGGYWANPTVQSATKNETLFEIASDLINNNGSDQVGFIYLQAGGGYGDVLGTDSLYNLYSATDVRKGLYPRAPAGYRSGQAGNINLNYKYPNPAGSGDKDDTKVLRLADIILIAAEAYFNAGDMTNANLYLNKVAQKRDPSFTGWADSGPQVLEDILIERRKELAFEGSRFWDLVRLQRSWKKIKNQSPLTTIAVTPATQALIFPIPQTELDANKSMVQNPGY